MASECHSPSELTSDILYSITELLGGQQRIEQALIDLQTDMAAVREGLPCKRVPPLRKRSRSSSTIADRAAPETECQLALDTDQGHHDHHGRGLETGHGHHDHRGHHGHHGRHRLSAIHAPPWRSGKDDPLEAATQSAQLWHLRQQGLNRSNSHGLASLASARGIDADWPACVEMHDCFKGTHTDPSAATSVRISDRQLGVRALPSVDSTSRCGCNPVIDPDSLFLIPMKVLIVLALVHDLIVIPYFLAWQETYDGFDMAMAEAAIGVWFVDIVLTFLTGYYLDGELERRLSNIAQSYLRGWFVPDLVALMCDLVSLTDTVRKLLGRRFALRTVGWIRVQKVVRMFSAAQERARSELVRLAVQGIQILMFIIWLNHIIGCAWYSIGMYAPSDTGGRWTDTLGQDIPGYNDDVAMYRYSTSFHWAMGQITSGGVENISAVNSSERAFSLVIGLFGLFIFSSIISLFNATMTNWQMMQQEQTYKMRALREYLAQNFVSQRTAIHVQRQVAERMRVRGRLVEKDVHALLLLSSRLRAELQFEVSGPHLKKHSIFRLCACAHQHAMKTACGEAVGTVLKMPGDTLFKERKPSLQVFFVVAGCVSYTIPMTSMIVEEDLIEKVSVSSWLCEAAIWARWCHVGSAEASESTELVAINVSRFLEELMKQEDVAIVMRDYAVQFHQRLTNSTPENSGWPTDIRVPDTDFVELVLSMDPDVQIILGTLTLLDARHRQAIAPEALEKLQMELDNRQCAIMMDGQGELFRALTIVVLHLENASGEVLVQVGRWEDDQLIEKCQLPGIKKSHKETAKIAVEHLLEHLSPLVGSWHLTRTELIEECKPSGTLGITTRYLRDVHYAVVDRSPEQCLPPVRCIDEDSSPKYSIYRLPQSGRQDNFDLFAWMPEVSFDDLVKSKAGKQVSATWLRLLDFASTPDQLPTRVAQKQGTSVDVDHGSPSPPRLGDAIETIEWGSNGHGKCGVTVTIVSAWDVGCRHPDHLPSPYCRVCVVGRPGIEAKTPVAELSQEPEWDCSLGLASATWGDLLEFEVRDSLSEGRARPCKTEDVGLLGRAVLRLGEECKGELRSSRPSEVRLPLEGGPEDGGILLVRVSEFDFASASCKELTDASVPPRSPGRSSCWEVQGWAVPDTPRPSCMPGCRSSPHTICAERWPDGDQEPTEGFGRWRQSLAFYARTSAASANHAPLMWEDCEQRE